MKIKKIGHCCLLINYKGLNFLTDPGNYSDVQNDINGIDIIIITHEHQDHFHIESVKKILKNNPNAQIITNKAVAKILAEDNIKSKIIGENEQFTINNVLIEGFGHEHAEIYKTWGSVENTGYFIDQNFFIQEMHL